MSSPPLAPSPTWPRDVAARHRALGLWAGEGFGAFLRERARRHADALAVVGVDAERERVTYAELDARADALAAGLAGTGLQPGDRVLVHLPNSLAFVEVLFGLWRAGCLPVFTLPAHREAELVAVGRSAGAAALVTARRHGPVDGAALGAAVRDGVPTLEQVLLADELPRGGPAPAHVEDPAAVAFLQLSGGTTGTPKLIPRTPDDYLLSVRESAAICGLHPGSRLLCALPAAHNFTMSSPGILGVLHAGGAVVMSPSPDPATCFGRMDAEEVTIVPLVPPLAHAWLDARASSPASLHRLEVLQVGGAKLATPVAERIEGTFGCTLQQVFGMAEGLVNYTRLDDPAILRTTTQGRPISPHDEVRVVDEAGRELPPGAQGLLETRGPYTIRGYYADADPGSFAPDGFYRTGDVVRQLPSGHLVVEGRAKDQINRGGEKVVPDELEAHLLAHPAVHDVAVVGLPDPVLGERTCAVLVPRGDPPRHAELRRFLRDRGVAAYKLPDRVEVVDALPGTHVGKVSRRALRAAVAASLAPANPTRSPTP